MKEYEVVEGMYKREGLEIALNARAKGDEGWHLHSCLMLDEKIGDKQLVAIIFERDT
jgi:hypothetical protein